MEGVAKVGETLSAAGLQPENATVKYQWQYSVDGDTDWKDISGENSETYVIDVEYVGKHIRLEVKGTGSYTGTKTSNVVGPVTYSNEAINEALGKVNAITGTAADVKVINDNADILGLDLTAFEALDKVTGQEGGRQTAVMKDLVSNKPSGGYDQETLKAVFDSIVVVRTATQASMDLVNEAESLENIDYVEDLLAAFKGVAEGHTIHSGKAISEKVTALEKLVSDFEALPEANQAAALTAVIDNKPEGGYLRSQSTLDALANAIAEQESEIEEAINEALGKVNAITGTAADVKVINDNADILGLDLTAFEALDKVTGQEGGRQTAVMKDLASNKPDEGYDQETLKAIFDSIVAVRTATQASMDLVNEAESLENIDYVEDLLAAFKGVAEGHTIHSRKPISEKVTALEGLVADFDALPEVNQEAALQAVIENKPEGGYLRSQSTLDALANAIAEQEGIIEGAVQAAYAAVNAAKDADEMMEAIEEKAALLGLDLTSYNELKKYYGDRQRAVSVDLVHEGNKGEGYTPDNLKDIFDAIVATRHVAQESMDHVNEATTIEELGIEWVTNLQERFAEAKDVYAYHSGEELTAKASGLADLVARYNALPEENQEAVLQAVLEGKTYTRASNTTKAFGAAVAKQEGIVGETKAMVGTPEALIAAVADEKVEEIRIIDSFELDSTITIQGKALTIDLNGKTLTPKSPKAFQIEDAAYVTFKNGWVNCGTGATSARFCSLVGNTTPDGDPIASGLIIDSDANINAYDVGVFIGGKGASLTVNGTLHVKNSQAYTDAGYAGVAIQGNGTASETIDYGGTEIIVNGTVTSEGAGMYLPQKGKLTIYAGKISGVSSGIALKAGSLTVQGGTIECTGDNTAPTEGHSNGVSGSGAAVQIESNNSYSGDIVVSISGGDIISNNGYAIYEYLSANASATQVNLMHISGGWFKSGMNSDFCLSGELADSNVGKNFISGGKFSNDPGDYCVEACNVEQVDGVWVVTESTR